MRDAPSDAKHYLGCSASLQSSQHHGMVVHTLYVTAACNCALLVEFSATTVAQRLALILQSVSSTCACLWSLNVIRGGSGCKTSPVKGQPMRGQQLPTREGFKH